MEGWIKLHRKLLDNEIIRDDNAYKLFTILLMLVNRKTGKYTCGRFQLGDIAYMNPNTVYVVLKRLEKKYKIITQESNNHFTTISILNWHDYQGNGNTKHNNQITTRQQPGNTKQEVKNKELKNIYSDKNYLLSDESKKYFNEKFPLMGIGRINLELEAMVDWITNAGKKGIKKDYQAFGRNWFRRIQSEKVKKDPNHIPYIPKRDADFTDLGAEILNKYQRGLNEHA